MAHCSTASLYTRTSWCALTFTTFSKSSRVRARAINPWSLAQRSWSFCIPDNLQGKSRNHDCNLSTTHWLSIHRQKIRSCLRANSQAEMAAVNSPRRVECKLPGTPPAETGTNVWVAKLATHTAHVERRSIGNLGKAQLPSVNKWTVSAGGGKVTKSLVKSGMEAIGYGCKGQSLPAWSAIHELENKVAYAEVCTRWLRKVEHG